MKILLSGSLLAVLTLSFLHKENIRYNAAAKQTFINYKQKMAVRCSPNLDELVFDDSTQQVPLLSGWGNYTMPVTVANDSAAIYFQQGINMYYGFHVIEAMASFEKAVQFDSSFAMGYWGKALSYGPNINDFGYSASPEALKAMQTAKALYTRNTAVEKALIDAMQVRYSPDSTQSRTALNQLYADAMKTVHHKFPHSADAATLYVDALMVQHPWDLYTKDYKAKSWTPEIVSTLESILKEFPQHPGASHYYIHAVEASSRPQRALTAAKKLPAMMPGVAHMVHMPSHIYIRSGYYGIGTAVNEQAVKGYYDYLRRYPAVVNNASLYLIHNLHMQATCANMNGDYALSMQSSIDCKNSFDSSWQDIPDYLGIFIQYVYITPLLTQIRFGKWDDLLAAPAVPAVHVYGNYLWHYGRGLAYARKHDQQHAAAELDSLQKGINAAQLKAPAPSYANPGIAGAEVAMQILLGVIAEEKNDYTTGIKAFEKAVLLEDSMIYNEPKDWVHPTRQYLGNILLKAKKYAAAASAFQLDLAVNPSNGWSLTGLAQARSGMKQPAAAKDAATKAKKAFAKTDVTIHEAVF